ncbi:hypothetical protein N0B31_00665 [Salinirubellus salinus]|uniref:Uncharacterized protein n=1 Tax=Salinirubellus salinus TaxID=1364945 RepID=A0A9E7R379_9EURY|nr:hypothetical protein [Salinirubellus salinus]UWM54807.1 hypothetical protein N0B31_00665 [Salinirubellus salinus]
MHVVSQLPVNEIIRIFSNAGPSVVGSFVAGASLTVAVLSYTYTVRANVRGVVADIEPIEVGGYRITPDLLEVRVRPPAQTSLVFRCTPVDPEGAGVVQFTDLQDSFGLSMDEFDSVDSIAYRGFEQFEDSGSDGEMMSHVSIRGYGFRMTIRSTDEKDVYFAVLGALRQISKQIESGKSES